MAELSLATHGEKSFAARATAIADGLRKIAERVEREARDVNPPNRGRFHYRAERIMHEITWGIANLHIEDLLQCAEWADDREPLNYTPPAPPPEEPEVLDGKRIVYQVFAQTDMTEGRGGLAPYGKKVFATEQAAWDSINDHGGVFGRLPGKNAWPIDKTKGVTNWQQYKERLGHAGDYDVRPIVLEGDDGAE